VRDNMPFGRVGTGEFGTYFIGYCRTPRVTEQMTENMFVGRPPDNYDRLLQPRGDRSPVLRTIRDIPGIRERHRRCGGDARCGINTRARTIYGPGARWFARSRLPQRRKPV
jgi:hypothetical protein